MAAYGGKNEFDIRMGAFSQICIFAIFLLFRRFYSGILNLAIVKVRERRNYPIAQVHNLNTPI